MAQAELIHVRGFLFSKSRDTLLRTDRREANSVLTSMVHIGI